MRVFRLFASLLLLSVFALAQGPKPVGKQGILDALKIGGLTQAELVQFVKQRGVDFRPTPAEEAELRRAGASAQLVAAVRASYRDKTQNASAPRVISSKPLTRTEVVTLLEVGTPSQKILAVARERGIDFRVTPDIATQLQKAGADRTLLDSLAGLQPNHAPVAVPPKKSIGRALVSENTAAAAPEEGGPPEPLPGTPAESPEPLAIPTATAVAPKIQSLAEMRKIYLEALPAGFDDLLKAEISKQLTGRVEVVEDQSQADAVLRGGSAFVVVDVTGSKVLWTDDVQSRSVFGFLRRGGNKASAEKLVARMKAQIERP
jgi:hypothetical protein